MTPPSRQPSQVTPSLNNVGTSYLLWCMWLFGVAGVHRLYNKKFFSGLLWLCTWGLFGVGQVLDLFLIPEMVEDHNFRVRMRLGYTPNSLALNPQSAIEVVVNDREYASASAKLTQEALMLKLLKAAHARGGKLSVTQGVLDTECSFAEVESTLQAMVKTGYVTICNDPDTGVVMYDFVEL